jgi:hypothetical protein
MKLSVRDSAWPPTRIAVTSRFAPARMKFG